MTNIRLFKFKMLHNDYLHKQEKFVFAPLLAEGKLWQYLVDIDTRAQQVFDTLVEQMEKAEGVTEQRKEENQMEWVARMNNVRSRVIETVKTEAIYS